MNSAVWDVFSRNFIRRRYLGYEYFVPSYALHRPAAKCLMNDSFYEPDTHAFVRDLFYGRSGSMIHAGAFYGDMIPSFAGCVSNLVCFEPVLENYVLARMCVEANKLDNVWLVHGALTDSRCNVRINYGVNEPLHRGGASKVDKVGCMSPGFMLDQFDYVDLLLIHLDVEGHELCALRGGYKTIKRFTPIIMIEDMNNECAGYLSELGYGQVRTIPGLRIYKSCVSI